MNGFSEELPPILSKIGQACYHCFMGKSELNSNGCVSALQRCSGCLRVSYCGSGEFPFEWNTGSMSMRNVPCISLSKGENRPGLAFFAFDEFET
jgi:splicing suppressor protein 51